MEKKFVFLEKICRLWALKLRKTHINMLTWKCEWKGRKELPRSLISPFVPLQGNRFYIPCGGRIKTSRLPPFVFCNSLSASLEPESLGLGSANSSQDSLHKAPKKKGIKSSIGRLFGKKEKARLGQLRKYACVWPATATHFGPLGVSTVFISLHFSLSPFFSCAYLTHSLS